MVTGTKNALCLVDQYLNEFIFSGICILLQILTLKLLLLLNFGGLLLILLLTHFFSKGTSRIHIVGWFCVVSSAGVFAAPLSIMVRFWSFSLVNFLIILQSLPLPLPLPHYCLLVANFDRGWSFAPKAWSSCHSLYHFSSPWVPFCGWSMAYFWKIFIYL